MNPARLKAYFYMLLATAIWGIAGPIIKFTLEGIEPSTFLAYRYGLSIFVGFLIFGFKGFAYPKKPKVILMLLAEAFLGSTLSLGLLFAGLKYTTVLNLTLISILAPLITAESGVRFLHERITKREKIGMAIALIGALFTVIGPLTEPGGDGTHTFGNILIFLHLASGIIPAILAKKLLREGVRATTITNFRFLVGFISLFIFTIYSFGFSTISSLPSLDFKYHLGVIFMALISGNLAHILFYKAQKTIEVAEAAIFSYLNPIFAAPLAILWLGEKITTELIVGFVIIAIGVTISEYKRTNLHKIKN